MAEPILPTPEKEGNELQTAEILAFPDLWLAQAEVRRCKLVVSQCETTIETHGAGRMNPDIAVAVAESLLPNYTLELAKAETVVASLVAGTALTHNGIIYSAVAGRA